LSGTGVGLTQSAIIAAGSSVLPAHQYATGTGSSTPHARSARDRRRDPGQRARRRTARRRYVAGWWFIAVGALLAALAARCSPRPITPLWTFRHTTLRPRTPDPSTPLPTSTAAPRELAHRHPADRLARGRPPWRVGAVGGEEISCLGFGGCRPRARISVMGGRETQQPRQRRGERRGQLGRCSRSSVEFRAGRARSVRDW